MPEDAQLALGLDVAPELALPDRLHRLGLPATTAVTLTRNRVMVVSWDPRPAFDCTPATHGLPTRCSARSSASLHRARRGRATRCTTDLPDIPARPLRSEPEAPQPPPWPIATSKQSTSCSASPDPNARHFSGALGRSRFAYPTNVGDSASSRRSRSQGNADRDLARHIRVDGWQCHGRCCTKWCTNGSVKPDFRSTTVVRSAGRRARSAFRRSPGFPLTISPRLGQSSDAQRDVVAGGPSEPTTYPTKAPSAVKVTPKNATARQRMFPSLTYGFHSR